MLCVQRMYVRHTHTKLHSLALGHEILTTTTGGGGAAAGRSSDARSRRKTNAAEAGRGRRGGKLSHHA